LRRAALADRELGRGADSETNKEVALTVVAFTMFVRPS
jgi:hypothetical protein